MQRRLQTWITAATTALSAGALAACAGATAYKPRDGGEYGYDVQAIEENRFVVTFKGNSRTERDTVTSYLLYRAAELTLDEGGDHFVITDRDVTADEDYRTTYTTIGPHYGRFYGLGPHYFGGIYYGPGFFPGGFGYDLVSARTREISEYAASAEILVREGEKPDAPSAFDAREVLATIGPRVERPDQS